MARSCEKEKKRERILKKSWELFKKNGYEEIKIERITKEVGISKGSFYTYFKTKEDVLFSILEKIEIEIENSINDIDTSEEPSKILYNLLEKRVELFLGYIQNMKLGNLYIMKSGQIDEFKNKITVFYTTFIKENIIKKYENKKIWDLEIISKYINSSIEGYFFEEIFENKGIDKDFEDRAKIAIKEIARFIDSALK
ncbi:TetR/AcrR family transcriptional regulator [Leptotrichia sp. oral taxon 218]|uniref:TetR/AcrR family transcriptional regulator n=1 Tax=Leptotrichia sp. oral taxon 218 TaxID=712361 RepID=UPI001B8B7AEE|nr:TetR/AcrR family transcriptional regulator [Leptotrichia sp. oral taxon 218]QUB95014.1 TetR/AcrR family transcriptional regulator [Leptotrichia sp. oral taxon 218]